MPSSLMPERLRQAHSKKHSSGKARDKKMENTPDVQMAEVADRNTGKKLLNNPTKETSKESKTVDESTGQYYVVDDYEKASNYLGVASDEAEKSELPQQKLVEPAESKDAAPPPTHASQREPSPPSLEVQMEVLRSESQKQVEKPIRAEVNKIQAMTQQQPLPVKMDETARAKEVHPLSSPERQKYEDKINALSNAGINVGEQVNILLDAQEKGQKYQSEIEALYRDALAHIQREKAAREESELNLRSEISEIRGSWQREKERAQKLMKTMAEMQNADPFKVDNDNIVSSVKELRYNIKNWVWAQRLIPSLPAQGVLSTYVTRAVGGAKDRGPNYEFLSYVTPNWAEYTEKSSDFRWLLQAYVWKRLVDMIFYDDFWAGNRRPIDEDDREYKLFSAHHALKIGLDPAEDAPETAMAQYRYWCSTTARILTQRISSQRQRHALAVVRNDILSPLVAATDSLPADMRQQIMLPEDLDAIIEAAMRLACTLAQQRAHYVFEIVPTDMYAKVEYNKTSWRDGMAHLYGSEQYNARTQMKVIFMTLSPRLLKFGTSEGTDFGLCTQVLEGEVETGIVPKKIGRRPLVS